MKELRKSALYALISVPITLVGYQIAFGLVETGNPLIFLYIPTMAVWELWQTPETPIWVSATMALTAQYLAFLFLIHITRVLIHSPKVIKAAIKKPKE